MALGNCIGFYGFCLLVAFLAGAGLRFGRWALASGGRYRGGLSEGHCVGPSFFAGAKKEAKKTPFAAGGKWLKFAAFRYSKQAYYLSVFGDWANVWVGGWMGFSTFAVLRSTSQISLRHFPKAGCILWVSVLVGNALVVMGIACEWESGFCNAFLLGFCWRGYLYLWGVLQV